jgi:AcrR family transcriptional regulator
MTELRLVDPEPAPDGPFSGGSPLPRRLPRGRHGIPAGIVVEHQRLRLLAAMAEALGEHGYAGVTTTHVSERANVSTSTFYKHFGNLWDCLLAAYVAAADRLCEAIESRCAEVEPEGEGDRLLAGIEAALELFSTEPQLGMLLTAQAPRESTALNAARRLLISRLAAMLRRTRGSDDQGPRPAGLDERLIDASLAFLHTRIARGPAERLSAHAPELAAILGRPQVAA